MKIKEVIYLYWFLVGSLFILYFFPFLSGKVLIGDDYTLQEEFFLNFKNFYGRWVTHPWLGRISFFDSFSTQHLILFLFPEWNGFSTTMTFGIITFMFLIANYQLAKSFSFAKIPSLICSLLFTFSPLYYTYIRTGHTFKLFTVIYMVFTFVCINKIWTTPKKLPQVIYCLLATLCLCIGLIHYAQQTYIYFFPVLVAYCLFLFLNYPSTIGVKKHLEKNRVKIFLIILIPFIFLIIGYPSLSFSFKKLTGKNLNSLFPFSFNSSQEFVDSSLKVKEIKKTSSQEKGLPTLVSQAPPNLQNDLSKKNQNLEQWDWATQWSLPKIESLDFLVPGIFGFISNDPDNPYWGKIGQSLFWEKTRKGLFNYCLTSNYVGLFLFIFLVYALFFVEGRIKWFWAGLILFNLFLSYGRYFFFYEFFYNFSYVERLRNPNKFLLIFYFCVAVLSGYGLNHFYQSLKKKFLDSKKVLKEQGKFFKNFIIGINGFLVIALIYVLVNQGNIEKTLNDYFNNNALVVSKIKDNIIFAFVKAIFFYNLALVVLYYLSTRIISKEKIRNLVIFLTFFLLLDQYFVNQHYFNFVRFPKGDNDPLVQFFNREKEKEPFRVKIISPRSRYLNYFKWNFARLNEIELFEYWAIRTGKLPARNANYLNEMNNHDLRIFKLANVKYLLANQPFHHQDIQLVKSFEISNTQEKIFIYQLNNYLKRFYLASNIKVIDKQEDYLNNLNSSEFNIHHSFLYQLDKEKFEKEKTPNWLYQFYQEQKTRTNQNNYKGVKKGEVKLMPNFIGEEYQLKLNIFQPQILVFLNPGKNWRVFYQGQELKDRLVGNYYFNSYLVKPSMEKVTVRLRSLTPQYPKINFLYLFFTLFLLGGLQVLKIKERRKKNKLPPATS